MDGRGLFDKSVQGRYDTDFALYTFKTGWLFCRGCLDLQFDSKLYYPPAVHRLSRSDGRGSYPYKPDHHCWGPAYPAGNKRLAILANGARFFASTRKTIYSDH